MLPRASALVLGKRTKRLLDMSIQASTALRCCSHSAHQLRDLRRRSVSPDDFLPEQHSLQDNGRGASPVCISEPNCIMQHNNFSTMDNSADASLDSLRDTTGMSFSQRFATLRSIGKCSNVNDLKLLLKKKTAPTCYVWCDPSPWMHITQGISMSINVNKMVKAGCKVKILMADWFARMDQKIGGNLIKTHTIGSYNIEMWKATGMDLDGVEFVLLSDEISSHAEKFWPLTMDIARKTDLSRIKKYLRFHAKIDTRGHGSINLYTTRDFKAAEILYPCLQCAAILFQKVDIWLLDLNQRGASVLAKQYCKRMKWEIKPIALLHNTLPNLLEHPHGEVWGDPRWAIFMEDDEEDVCGKVRKAFCPPKLAKGNPCLEYIKYIIFPWFGKFELVPTEDGGNKTFWSMKELIADYESGTLQPADVKQALAKALNMMLQPIHDRFRSSAKAEELVKAMRVDKWIEMLNCVMGEGCSANSP